MATPGPTSPGESVAVGQRDRPPRAARTVLSAHPQDVTQLFDEFFSMTREGAQYRQALLVNPKQAVRDAAQKIGVKWNDDDVAVLAVLLTEEQSIVTLESFIQEQRAKQRIELSITTLRRAFRLTLIMYNTMFYLGVLLLACAVIVLFTGQEVAGIVLGGIGLSSLILFLLRRPIDGIHESVGNLSQLHAAYNSFFVQLAQWQLYYDYQSDPASIAAKQRVGNLIHQSTLTTLDLIETYCKVDAIAQSHRGNATEVASDET